MQNKDKNRIVCDSLELNLKKKLIFDKGNCPVSIKINRVNALLMGRMGRGNKGIPSILLTFEKVSASAQVLFYLIFLKWLIIFMFLVPQGATLNFSFLGGYAIRFKYK